MGEKRYPWTPLAVAAAALLGIGAAGYAGSRYGDDRPPPLAEPAPPWTAPSAEPAVPAYVAPAPSVPATSPPATRQPAARTPVFRDRTIASTSVLTTGQSWSTNRLELTVTGGGNLVLRDQGRTVWQTGTTAGVKLVMQNDGHLVLYDAGNGTVWSSGTAGSPGAVLVLRAAGTMVIALNGRALFSAPG